jgi:nucleoside-diphosphate-sugar epimerase
LTVVSFNGKGGPDSGTAGSALMKVLVTGHNGYIGPAVVTALQLAGHDVVGLDSDLFDGCGLGERMPAIPAMQVDVRDVRAADLIGFDAIVHLAALSNDPLGDLDPELTYEINHRASVRLAGQAKAAGVRRFLFSSSCSLYGAASPEDLLTEEAAFNPVTAYASSKVRVEHDVARLADRDFSPTFLRNATAYGVSPRLRGDLVVNDLVGAAYTTGEILMKSDGTPWRPLVHIQDIARAFVGVLHAERYVVHNQAFNVGSTEENYQIRDIAELVRQEVPGSRVTYLPGAGPDLRCYRVNFGKLARTLPDARPRWTLRQGIAELHEAYQRHDVKLDELRGPRYLRIMRIRDLVGEGRLDGSLRWSSATSAQPDAVLARE